MRPSAAARLVAIAVLAGTPAAAHAQPTVFNFSTGNGNFTTSGSGAGAWDHGLLPLPPGGSGTAWNTNGQTTPGDFGLESPLLTVVANGTVTGSFQHRFFFDNTFDGGQLQYRVVVGGTGTWLTVPANRITGTSYTGLMNDNPEFGSSIFGQSAFTGQSAGYATQYVTSTFTLGSGTFPYTTGAVTNFTVGQQIQIRFFAAYDDGTSSGSPDWQVGGLTVNNVVPVPEPVGVAAVAAVALAARRLRRRA